MEWPTEINRTLKNISLSLVIYQDKNIPYSRHIYTNESEQFWNVEEFIITNSNVIHALSCTNTVTMAELTITALLITKIPEDSICNWFYMRLWKMA